MADHLVNIKYGILFLLYLSAVGLQAQTDTTQLSYEEYLNNVLRFHPLSQKSDLLQARAAARLLGARGLIDPYLEGSWDEKNFDEKLYYRQYRGRLVFPTRMGVNIIGGYENTDGIFLNPEDKTDDLGLWSMGLEVDLIQGLINNERKIALERADVFRQLTENEQQLVLNELIFEASTAYFNWQLFYEYQLIYLQNIAISEDYLEATRSSFENGEKTAMDTLEAFTLLQEAITLLQKNEYDLVKARQNVENYLWFENVPVLLQPATVPLRSEDPNLDPLQNIDSLDLSNHPAILQYANKIKTAELDQVLKREKLKPKLKAKYNALLATREDIVPTFESSNYKWGLSLELPIRQRSDRASIQEGVIKISELSLDMSNKENTLRNKIESRWIQQGVLSDQVDLFNQYVNNAQLLLEGEREKFQFGESSVFLLNKRQEKYVQAQLKLVETITKMKMTQLEYLFFSNDLLDSFN